MYESLFQHINRHVSITKEEFQRVEHLFEIRKYRKHQYILQEGDISRNETFVLNGCARMYEIDEKGVEHVLQFGPENWWVGDLYSFVTGTPTRYNIDCLEDCEVLQITKEREDILFDLSNKIERYFRLLIQNAYVAATNRLFSNMSKPATERYLEFLQKYPTIGQRVSDKQIASYLGITPPSLSRLRAGIASK
jgi:CRP-like cAMP-binding protein